MRKLPPSWHRALAELKRRRVFRAAALYAAAAFVIWQVADIAAPALHLPEWTMTLVVLLALLGFPLAVVAAWLFDFTPSGLERTFALATATAVSLDVVEVPTSQMQPVARPHGDKSLAVLPFINTSTDPDNEYFADGLTEELIADLAQVRALRVISRTSSMRLKGSTKGMRAIGQELGVRYAIEGSVRKAGTSLRITAQLIDTEGDVRLWAEKYSGDIEDVFDLQERVSRAIVDALHITLSSDEAVRLTDRPIKHARAFELYLQARQEIRHYQVDRALPLLQQAIAIEGEVPALRALRAAALIAQVRSGMSADLRPLDEAEVIARELIEIVPDAAYGYSLLGAICYERGEHNEGVRALRGALERDPNDADVHFYLSISLQAAGQTDATEVVGRRVAAIDPLAPTTALLAGVETWFVGRAAEGLEATEKSVALDPDNLIYNWALGYHYALVGRVADAAKCAEFMHIGAPLMPYTLQLRGLVAAAEGRKAEALVLLEQINTTALDGHTRFHIGESCAMAGDTVRAMALVEQAVDHNFYPYRFIAEYSPFLQPLRGSAEFARIVAKAEQRVKEFQA